MRIFVGLILTQQLESVIIPDKIKTLILSISAPQFFDYGCILTTCIFLSSDEQSGIGSISQSVIRLSFKCMLCYVFKHLVRLDSVKNIRIITDYC